MGDVLDINIGGDIIPIPISIDDTSQQPLPPQSQTVTSTQSSSLTTAFDANLNNTLADTDISSSHDLQSKAPSRRTSTKFDWGQYDNIYAAQLTTSKEPYVPDTSYSVASRPFQASETIPRVRRKEMKDRKKMERERTKQNMEREDVNEIERMKEEIKKIERKRIKSVKEMDRMKLVRREENDRNKRKRESIKEREQSKQNTFIRKVRITSMMGHGIFEINAPSGTLGITLGTNGLSNNGRGRTYVKVVHSSSVLEGKVNVGGIILSIDDEDASHLNATEIMSIMARKSEHIRVLRFRGNTTFQKKKENRSWSVF